MDKIAILAELRARADEAAARKEALMDEFLQSGDYESAEFQAKELASRVDALEKEIKRQFESEYVMTGNKKPHPAIQLKEFDVTTVEYDLQKAHAWCVQNFTPALKLDTKTFDKAAKAGSIPAEIAHVKPGTEIRAQIATDLSKYLE